MLVWLALELFSSTLVLSGAASMLVWLALELFKSTLVLSGAASMLVRLALGLFSSTLVLPGSVSMLVRLARGLGGVARTLRVAPAGLAGAAAERRYPVFGLVAPALPVAGAVTGQR